MYTAVIKVVTARGHGDIIEYSDPILVAKGIRLSSNELANREIGSTWLCEIDLPNGSSRKIRSIQRYDISAVAMHDIASSEMPNSEPVSDDSGSVGAVVILPPVLPLVDLREWQSDDYYISHDARQGFGAAYNMLLMNPNKPSTLLLTGPSGYGKSTLVEQFAKFTGLTFCRFNTATVRDLNDWYGYSEVVNDNGTPITKFVPNEMMALLQRGNCVVLFDELNRIEPYLHNGLFPLLDDSAATVVHNMPVVVGPNVVIVATINEGYQYGGTFSLDEALKNRFDFVLEVSAMSQNHEICILESRTGIDYDCADKIIYLATVLRDNGFTCSTRDTLRVARMVQAGLNLRDAFEFAIVRRVPGTEDFAPMRKSLVDAINIQLGERVI